jgi:hypothetical protein
LFWNIYCLICLCQSSLSVAFGIKKKKKLFYLEENTPQLAKLNMAKYTGFSNHRPTIVY